jgi:tRNA A-37 threonylcarbamoyl transferase component Bud32
METISFTSLTTAPERREAIQDIRTSVELNIPLSTRRELGVATEMLAQSILLNQWLLPSRERGNRMLAQGSSERPNVTSATIPITSYDGQPVGIEVDVVSKPIEDLDKAIRELMNMERLHLDTTIRGVLPFAAMDVKTEDGRYAYVLSRLEKGVLPVEQLRVENFLPIQRDAFLEQLGVFTAEMANQGVLHKDLLPKNIWFDTTQSAHQQFDFGLFDLESSEIINRAILLRMLNISEQRGLGIKELLECARIATGYLEDAADLAGALMKLMPAVLVRERFVIPYLDARLPVVCQRPFDESLSYIMKEAFLNENTTRSSA